MDDHYLVLARAYVALCGSVLAILVVRVLVSSRQNRRGQGRWIVSLYWVLGFVNLSLGSITLLITQETFFPATALVLSGAWILYSAVTKSRILERVTRELRNTTEQGRILTWLAGGSLALGFALIICWPLSYWLGVKYSSVRLGTTRVGIIGGRVWGWRDDPDMQYYGGLVWISAGPGSKRYGPDYSIEWRQGVYFLYYQWWLTPTRPGPTRTWWTLGIPIAAPISMACILPGLWLYKRRGWRVAHEGHKHCDECGYDLTGNVSGVCPECGWKLPARQR